MTHNDPKNQNHNEAHNHEHGHKHGHAHGNSGGGGCGKHSCGCSHKSHDAAKPAADAVAQNAEQPAGDAPASPLAEGNILALQLEIAQLKTQRDESQQQVLRTMADYQNFARRSRTEVADARSQENFDTAKKLVEIVDEFDRALAVDPQKVTVENLLKGVELVHARFLQMLNRMGIERLEAKPGEEFNPKLHEALMHTPATEEVKAHHVAMQLQPGYIMGEKTVRPAKVSVAQ